MSEYSYPQLLTPETEAENGSPFVGGCDYSELIEVLGTLAPVCPTCTGRRLYFCLEENCQDHQPIFCYRCERFKHSLHRVNELYLAFVDRKNVPSRNQQAVHFLVELIEDFKKRRLDADELAAKSMEFANRLQHIIQLYEKMLESLLKSDQLDRLYQTFEKALALHRKQIREQQSGEVELLANLREMWEGHKREFQEVSATVKFSNSNKLDKCLTASDIGKHIDDYESTLNKIREPAKNPRLRQLNRSQESFELTKPTWLDEKERHRKEQFNSDLSSLFEQTHIDQTVNTRWRNIPLQIGAIRSATLQHNELLSHRPGRLFIGSLSLSEKQQLSLAGNPTLKHLTAKDWTQRKLPPGLCSLQLQIEQNTEVVFPKPLKSLKLVIASRGYRFRRRRSSTDTLDRNDTFERIKQLEQLKHLTICKQTMPQTEFQQYVQFALKQELRTMVLLSNNQYSGMVLKSGPILEEAYAPHHGNALRYHFAAYRRALMQALVLLRSARLGDSYFTEHLLDFAELGVPEAKVINNPPLLDSDLSARSSLRSGPPRPPLDSPRSLNSNPGEIEHLFGPPRPRLPPSPPLLAHPPPMAIPPPIRLRMRSRSRSPPIELPRVMRLD